MVQPAGVGGHGNHHLGVQVNLVERKRHRPFLFSLPGSFGNLFGHLFLLGGGLRLLISLLLLHRLLLLLLLGLLLHSLLLILLLCLLLSGLLLILLLLLRLSDRLLTIVIVVAAADEGQTGRAHAGAGRSSQERPPRHPVAAHSLPVVSFAHETTPSRITDRHSQRSAFRAKSLPSPAPLVNRGPYRSGIRRPSSDPGRPSRGRAAACSLS